MINFTSDISDEEKQSIIEDIAAVTKNLIYEDSKLSRVKEPNELKDLYERYKEPLFKKFGNGKWYTTWDCVRKLSIFYTGKRYAKDLTVEEAKKAVEFAENILVQMLESNK